MTEHPERVIRKFGPRGGFAPRYRALHEVCITKNLGPERNDHLVLFIQKRISGFGGKTGERHGVPQMLFERRQDAQRFANEMAARLNIHREHITVKAKKGER